MMPEPTPNPGRAARSLLLAIVCLGVGAGISAADPTSGEAPASAGSVASTEAVASAMDAEAAALPRAETIFPQLEPILVNALSQSPTMIQESLTRLAATYDEKADRAHLYPRVGGYGHLNAQREERLDSDDTRSGFRTYYDFNLNQPVYHWGAIQAQADVGRIYRLIADRNFVEAYQLLANRIRDAYLQLVALRIAQRNRGIELERTKAQLEIARQQVAEGRVPASTVASIEYGIEAQHLGADRANFALERLLRQFRNLVGQPEFSLADVPETIPVVAEVAESRAYPLRTDFVTRRGFEDSVAYFRAENALDIERLRLRIIRTELRPKFSFATGISQDLDERAGASVEDRYVVTTYYAGLRVNWAIWDSKLSQSRARAVQARIRRAEKSLEVLEKDLIESIEAAEKELGFSTRGLRIAERSFSGAGSSYRAVQDLQKEGRASQDEVDAALVAWRKAEYGVSEARRDYLRTVNAFLTAIQADPLIDKLQRDGRIPR